MQFPEPSRAKFVAAITMLAEAFCKQTSKVMLAAYEAGLCDLPISEVESACLFAIRTNKFMPTVAELRSINYQLRKYGGRQHGNRQQAPTAANLSCDPKHAAEQAWLALSHARNSFWWSKTVTFEDRAINATVRCTGGWQRLLEMTDEQFNNWYRKDFIASYLANHGSHLHASAYAPLRSESGHGATICINADLSVSDGALVGLDAPEGGGDCVGRIAGELKLQAIGRLERP